MKHPLERLFGSRQTAAPAGEHWLTISDLMAGLMMVFLLISVALMRSAFLDRDRMREVAVAYREGQIAIDRALRGEFEADLEKWDAAIDADSLTFEFRSPEVLFEAGASALQPRFATILTDFFPRYRRVLRGFDDVIEEVRLEGHTSSEWPSATEDEAYFNNMRLSQGRTRSVLEYVHGLPALPDDRSWVKRKVAAVGFSSSRLVTDTAGREDPEASRRVLFRVVTNAETQIRTILEQ